MVSTRAASAPIKRTDREEIQMKPDTLSGAYATKLGRPAQPAPRPVSALPLRPRLLSPASQAEPPLPDSEALFIALRRSLASCRDTTQLRMLAAFEGPRKTVV
jgi:hypothetical protein